MSNNNLKKEMLEHFKRCNVRYDKKAFNSFFRHYEQIASTDLLDLNKKKDKLDFNFVFSAVCLAFEEHERLLK
jgi:hypothetical protein